MGYGRGHSRRFNVQTSRSPSQPLAAFDEAESHEGGEQGDEPGVHDQRNQRVDAAQVDAVPGVEGEKLIRVHRSLYNDDIHDMIGV